MASLFKLITNIPEQDWNYYYPIPNNKTIERSLVEGNDSNHFIREYFRKAGKENVLLDFDPDAFGIARANHTVAIFFLGILIFRNTILKERNHFSSEVDKPYEIFNFIWFLTCLSHDAAYYNERDQQLLNVGPDLNQMKAHLQIEHDLTQQRVPYVPSFMFELCESYYRYRYHHAKYPGVDHGIFAGIKMFDRLVKNRIAKAGNANFELNWDKSLDKQYAYAAATVAVHNMYYPKDEERDVYKNNGLEKLIGKQPIKAEDAPLLFLLGLVDTIDPVKAFGEVNPIFILKNTYLTFQSANQITIRFSKKVDDVANYFRRAISCAEWLSVKVKEKDRAVVISFS